MSQENIKEFFNEVQNNEIFGKEYKTLLTSCKDLSQDKAIEKVIEFAKEKGYHFSSQDIKSFTKEKKSDELKEEELDAVSGGIGGGWGWAAGANFTDKSIESCFGVGTGLNW